MDTGVKLPVLVDRARSEEQRGVHEAIAAEELCPFCPEQLPKHHRKPILKRTEHWVVTTSQWPYENTRYHFLLVSTSHIERLTEISKDSWDDILEIAQELEREVGIESGAIGIRFGEPENNGGSVRHLHVHLIVADPDATAGKRVRFPMGPKIVEKEKA